MSFGTVEKPPDQRRPYNINDAETSSNQENIVVPYFSGVARLPVDFISPLYNLTSKKVKQQGDTKGKGGGGDSGQRNWYADFGGITNVCADDAPNDAILNVLVNGEPVLQAPLFRAPGTHYVAFSLPKFCQACRFYWGTKDQPIDTLVLYPRQDAVPTGVNPRDISTWPRLNANGDPVDDVTELPGVANPKSGHYDIHGAYRNQGLFVAKQFFLGSSPNMPSVELILARGTAFFAGGRFEAGDAGVNPMGMPYEIFTDPMFGAGLPESRLVAPSFQDTADAMDADNIALAPAFRGATSARSLFADYFQYYDGFFRRNGSSIEAGYFDHGNIDVGALQQLGSDDFTEQPKIKPGNLSDTKNTFFVAYTNREKWYKDDDTEGYIDQANYERVGGVQHDDRLERRHIISSELAVRHGVEWGSIFALELATGSGVCRRDRINGLTPGQRFKSNISALALSFVWRVKEMERPTDRDGTVKLTIEAERGLWPTLFLPPSAPKPPDFEVRPDAIAHSRIVELPSGLKDSAAIQVQVLAERPNTDILGAKIRVSPDDDIYTLARTQNHFAVRGKLAVAYSSAQPDLDVVTGITVDLLGVDLDLVVGQSDAERDDNQLLCWSARGEIFSIGAKTALGNGRFNFKERRALYGTTKSNHFVDDEVWFLFRDWIERVEDKNFAPGGSAFFKLQPYTYGGDYDIDLVTAIPFNFAGGAVSAISNLQLTTTARVAAGQIESRIAATWDYALDQDIFAFEVAIKRTTDLAWGQTRSVNTPSTDWEVAPSTSYDVRVRPINSHGEAGAWCAAATIVSASISPFSVSGLELVGQGNDHECRERDFKFACRLNSPSSGVSIGGVIQTGVQDPAFAYLLWQVFVGGALVYQEQTTAPHFEFTYSKNEAAAKIAGAAGPFAQITLNVYAVDSLHNVSAPAVQTFQNSAPVSPSNLSAFAANNRTILVSWTEGPETDLDRNRIYESNSNDPATATLIATVDSKNTVFLRSLPGATGSVTLYYWIRAVDTFGNLSPFSAQAHATSDPLAASIADVEDFEIDVTKVFLGKIIVLKGDIWSANTPAAGSIAWNAHQVIFNGVKYDIPAGNTAFKYVYWNAGDSVYTPSDTQLALSSDRFLVYQNVGGTPRGLWNVFANAVIGSANIIDLAVKNAHIENMAVEKLIAGFIVGKQFIIENDGDNAAAFKSIDYDPGVAGIYFGVGADGKGYLEVNNGFFRGTIVVGSGGATLNDIAAAAALGATDPAARINSGSTLIAGGKIVVNGATNFAAGYDPSGKIPAGGGAADVNANATTIDGGKITTNTVEAAHLKADTVLGKRIYVGTGGKIESTDYAPGGPGFHIGEDGIEISAGVFRDGVVIRTLAAPTFTNDFYGTPLSSRTWNDNDFVSVRAHGPAGKKIRFTMDGSEVTATSPYWPWHPINHGGSVDGDGTGPDDFIGYVLNGSDFSGLIRARAVSGPNGEVLGNEATIRLTHVPIDLLPLPVAPAPDIIFSSGTRGADGYKVRIVGSIAGAQIKWSWNAGAGGSYSDYDPAGNYNIGTGSVPTSNIGEVALGPDFPLAAYVVKDGYAPSAVTFFYNTAIDPDWTDPGWHGPPGTFPP